MRGRCELRGVEHVLVEQRVRRVDRGELELLLRAEVREEAALAHPDRLCQAADRQARDALDRRQLCGLMQNRIAAPLTVAAPSGRRAVAVVVATDFDHRLTR